MIVIKDGEEGSIELCFIEKLPGVNLAPKDQISLANFKSKKDFQTLL